MTELVQHPADPSTEPTGPTQPIGPIGPIGPSRRQVLLTGGIVAAAAAVTAACGSSGSASSTTGAGGSTPAGSSAPAGSSPAAGSGGPTTVAAADVPVGGGVILADPKVVVTQPAAGEFKAFTAVCTHQGCTVASVADGVIVCPCHGSRFSITDGSVEGGPAPAPLASVPVSVSGGTITVSA